MPTFYKQFALSILHFAVRLTEEVDTFVEVLVALDGVTYAQTFQHKVLRPRPS
jgi:hypothetical protein